MKSVILITAAALLGSSAFAGTCMNGTLNNFDISGFSCTWGNLEFSNFSYSDSASPSSAAIPAASVDVSFISGGGIVFGAGWDVRTQNNGSSEEQDSTVYFSVTGINGALIDDINLNFDGSYTGNGVSSVTEKYCAGVTNVNNCTNPASSFGVSNPPSNDSDKEVTFSPVDSIAVSKDINVTSGPDVQVPGNDCWRFDPSTANISTVTDSFSTTAAPEPSTLLLLGGGLLGIGLIRKRRS
ncbi:MAG TPA: PEP-CTERM sorting domain-containing protein [Bryobacteraceae bacterium]|nr:PEP-CTERM sorting domain-containing protein [Bryobacteraceae bacterium]